MTSPAIHFNWTPESLGGKNGFQYSGVAFSLVHHSNGQDLEFESLFDEESTDEDIRSTIENLADTNPSWADGVSRGWNFIELSTKFNFGRNVRRCTSDFLCTQISAGIKIPVFTNPDNDIWWEPGNDAKYQD